jgi:polyisoprenyl-teichoic acid--peptidoglycan teichoic acid transferase
VTPRRVDRTRRRVAGAIAFVIALAAVAILRAVVTRPAAETASSAAASPPALVVGHAHDGGYVPYPGASRPMFILVLGSDARPGEAVDRSRSDAIHVVGIDFQRHRASVIDIPRDSWVEIPGHGLNKINAAMSIGGVPLTVQTVEALTGIRFDDYALTSFPGLNGMVDGIGGLRIRVPYDIDDPTDGGPPIAAGSHTLDGDSALAFARARHNVPGGDFGRTHNQGAMLIAALRQFQAEADRDPGSVLTWIATFMQNVRTDLPIDEVTALAYAATRIPASKVNDIALVGTTGYEGTQSVVHLSPDARGVFADIRDDGIVDDSAQ